VTAETDPPGADPDLARSSEPAVPDLATQRRAAGDLPRTDLPRTDLANTNLAKADLPTTDLPTADLATTKVDTEVYAVVFDLGNVLITWDPLPAIAKTVGEREARRFLSDESFDFMAWNREQDAGRGWEEAEAAALQAHPRWARAILAYRENYPYSLVRVIEDTAQILRELHVAGIRLYALTNWSTELFPLALNRFDFLSLFEDIVVSGQEGVAKPDPEIFKILHERIGHALAECVFIDDSRANVEAARRAGLDAILFTDTGHLRADLVMRGLPLSPG
jgi:2-haloacid dehalogenase